MKHIIKVGLLLFLMPMLLISSAAYADDGDGDMNVNIGITTPGTANVGVGIDANEANVWINGYGLADLAAGMGYQAGAAAGAAAGSAAFQNSVPNSRYSQASTGYLPPLSSNSVVAEVAPPGKYDNWVLGWQGYFCPHTNLDPMVYHGSGCGGKWGVCDGYPDMWVRRQIAGLAPEFVAQKEKLNTVIEALAKVIVTTEKYNGMLNGNGGISDLMKAQMAQLEDVSLGLSVLEQEHIILEARVEQQTRDFNRKLLIISSAFAFALLCLAAAVLYLTTRVSKLRPRSYRELN
jgi:hypothetical protein